MTSTWAGLLVIAVVGALCLLAAHFFLPTAPDPQLVEDADEAGPNGDYIIGTLK